MESVVQALIIKVWSEGWEWLEVPIYMEHRIQSWRLRFKLMSFRFKSGALDLAFKLGAIDPGMQLQISSLICEIQIWWWESSLYASLHGAENSHGECNASQKRFRFKLGGWDSSQHASDLRMILEAWDLSSRLEIQVWSQRSKLAAPNPKSWLWGSCMEAEPQGCRLRLQLWGSDWHVDSSDYNRCQHSL